MVLCSVIFLCMLLFFPEIAIAGSKYGATLWLSQLLPTLLPFFIAIRLFDICLPNIATKRFFLLTGLLCGYPAGAALVMGHYEKRLISRRQAYFFLGFVNNPSPMFILVFCGNTILGLSSGEAFLLFGIILLASLLGSLLFFGMQTIKDKHRRKKSIPYPHQLTRPLPITADSKAKTMPLSFSEQLDTIILDSFTVLVKIGGYVILFSIFGQFINQLLPAHSAPSILVSGSLEITSGVSYIKSAVLSATTKKVLTAAILTFGGLSAAAQTSSILSKSELSVFPYIINKGINSLIAAILSLFLIRVL